MDEAKTNGQSLNLLLRIVPIVGFVVGGLALVFGLFVLRRSDRSDSSSAAKHDKTAAAGV